MPITLSNGRKVSHISERSNKDEYQRYFDFNGLTALPVAGSGRLNDIRTENCSQNDGASVGFSGSYDGYSAIVFSGGSIRPPVIYGPMYPSASRQTWSSEWCGIITGVDDANSLNDNARWGVPYGHRSGNDGDRTTYFWRWSSGAATDQHYVGWSYFGGLTSAETYATPAEKRGDLRPVVGEQGFSVNALTHILMTFDTGIVTCYINGVEDWQFDLTSAMTWIGPASLLNYTPTYSLGTYTTTQSRDAAGSYLWLAFHDEALSPADIFIEQPPMSIADTGTISIHEVEEVGSGEPAFNAGNNTSAQDISASLYMKFDGDYTDDAGPYVPVNWGSTLVESDLPFGTSAVEFTSDYIDTTWEIIEPTGAFAFWFKMASGDMTTTNYFCGQQYWSGIGYTLAAYIDTAGICLIAVRGADNVWYSAESSANMADDEWHHFVGNWNNVSGLEIWLDAEMHQAVTSATDYMTTNVNTPLHIGSLNSSTQSNPYFPIESGAMDDFRIYEQLNLTSADIQALYVKTNPAGNDGPLGITDRTTALWTFDTSSEPTPEQVGNHPDDLDLGHATVTHVTSGWGRIVGTDPTDDGFKTPSSPTHGGMQTPDADRIQDYCSDTKPTVIEIVGKWPASLVAGAIPISNYSNNTSLRRGYLLQWQSDFMYWQTNNGDSNYRWNRMTVPAATWVDRWFYWCGVYEPSDITNTTQHYMGDLASGGAMISGTLLNGAGGTMDKGFSPLYIGRNSNLTNTMHDMIVSHLRITNPDTLPTTEEVETQFAAVQEWAAVDPQRYGLTPRIVVGPPALVSETLTSSSDTALLYRLDGATSALVGVDEGPGGSDIEIVQGSPTFGNPTWASGFDSGDTGIKTTSTPNEGLRQDDNNGIYVSTSFELIMNPGTITNNGVNRWILDVGHSYAGGAHEGWILRVMEPETQERVINFQAYCQTNAAGNDALDIAMASGQYTSAWEDAWMYVAGWISGDPASGSVFMGLLDGSSTLLEGSYNESDATSDLLVGTQRPFTIGYDTDTAGYKSEAQISFVHILSAAQTSGWFESRFNDLQTGGAGSALSGFKLVVNEIEEY